MLPVVHENIGYSLQREIPEDDHVYLLEQMDRIYETNPCIARFIDNYAIETDDPVGAALCGVMIYRLLESQAEAEELNDLLKYDPDE